jgi:hypothetical protein
MPSLLRMSEIRINPGAIRSSGSEPMTEKPKSRWGINLKSVSCPACKEQMPVLRVPNSVHELMWGGWTCPKCGCRMDKWGKALAKARGKGE